MPGLTQVIPDFFCWTRFGTEAGETIEEILDRKEQERQNNGGVFFWGIGNSVAPGIAALLERCERPEVLFSPIKSRPRQADSSPLKIIDWRAGQTLSGERFELPVAARVTSGGSPRRESVHYALVCTSPQPLALSESGERIDFRALRNLVSGNPLGASQVTAVVSRLHRQQSSGMRYMVALRAELTWPYFVRLTEASEKSERLASVS